MASCTDTVPCLEVVCREKHTGVTTEPSGSSILGYFRENSGMDYIIALVLFNLGVYYAAVACGTRAGLGPYSSWIEFEAKADAATRGAPRTIAPDGGVTHAALSPLGKVGAKRLKRAPDIVFIGVNIKVLQMRVWFIEEGEAQKIVKTSEEKTRHINGYKVWHGPVRIAMLICLRSSISREIKNKLVEQTRLALRLSQKLCN